MTEPSLPITPMPKRSANRPEEISERIKGWMEERNLKPGGRLRQGRWFMSQFKASTSTGSEALRVLKTGGG